MSQLGQPNNIKTPLSPTYALTHTQGLKVSIQQPPVQDNSQSQQMNQQSLESHRKIVYLPTTLPQTDSHMLQQVKLPVQSECLIEQNVNLLTTQPQPPQPFGHQTYILNGQTCPPQTIGAELSQPQVVDHTAELRKSNITQVLENKTASELPLQQHQEVKGIPICADENINNIDNVRQFLMEHGLLDKFQKRMGQTEPQVNTSSPEVQVYQVQQPKSLQMMPLQDHASDQFIQGQQQELPWLAQNQYKHSSVDQQQHFKPATDEKHQVDQYVALSENQIQPQQFQNCPMQNSVPTVQVNAYEQQPQHFQEQTELLIKQAKKDTDQCVANIAPQVLNQKISQPLARHSSSIQHDKYDVQNSHAPQIDMAAHINDKLPSIQPLLQQPQMPFPTVQPNRRNSSNHDKSNPRTISSMPVASGSSNSIFKEELQAYQCLVKNMHAQLKNLTGVMSQLQQVSSNLKQYKSASNSSYNGESQQEKKESSSGSNQGLNGYSPLQILQNQMQGMTQISHNLMPKNNEQGIPQNSNQSQIQSMMQPQGPQQRTSQMPLMNYQSTNADQRKGNHTKVTKSGHIQPQIGQKLPQNQQSKFQQISNLEMQKMTKIQSQQSHRMASHSPQDQLRQSPMILPNVNHQAFSIKGIQTNDDLQQYLMRSGLFQSNDSTQSLKEQQNKNNALQAIELQKINQNNKLVDAGIVQTVSISKQEEVQPMSKDQHITLSQGIQLPFDNKSSITVNGANQPSKIDDYHNQQHFVDKNTSLPVNTAKKPAHPVQTVSEATIPQNEAQLQLQNQLKLVQEQAQQFIQSTQGKFTSMMALINQTQKANEAQGKQPEIKQINQQRSPSFQSSNSLIHQQSDNRVQHPMMQTPPPEMINQKPHALANQVNSSQALQHRFDSSPLQLNITSTPSNPNLRVEHPNPFSSANKQPTPLPNAQMSSSTLGQPLHISSNPNGVQLQRNPISQNGQNPIMLKETKKNSQQCLFELQQQQKLNSLCYTKLQKDPRSIAILSRFPSCPQRQEKSKEDTNSLCSVAQKCFDLKVQNQIRIGQHQNQFQNEDGNIEQKSVSAMSYKNNAAKKELSDQEDSSNSDYYLNQRNLYVGKYPYFGDQNQSKRPQDNSCMQDNGKNKILAFELKLVDKLQRMDKGLDNQGFNMQDRKVDFKNLQGDADSELDSPDTAQKQGVELRKKSADFGYDNKYNVQGLNPLTKSQMPLIPRFKSTHIKQNQLQNINTFTQIQQTKNSGYDFVPQFTKTPMQIKYPSQPYRMSEQSNQQVVRIMNPRQVIQSPDKTCEGQNLQCNQFGDQAMKKENPHFTAQRFYSEALTKDEKANGDEKSIDFFDNTLNDQSLLDAQATQNEDKLPFVLYLNMARTNFSSKQNQKDQQIQQYQQETQVGKRFFSNQIRFSSGNQQQGAPDVGETGSLIEDQASSKQQEGQTTAKGPTSQSGPSMDLIDIQTRMNQIKMAIQTVNDNQFIILKSVQKESRRSGKLPLSAAAALKVSSKNEKDSNSTIGPEKKNSQAFNQSNYRGVCSNGSKWQTMVLDRGFKYYSTSLVNQDLAARVYDRFVLESQGLRAKTNFNYSRLELMLILKDIAEDFKFNNSADVQQNRKRISFNCYRMQPELMKFDQMSVPFYEKRRMAKGSRKKREQQQTESIQ